MTERSLATSFARPDDPSAEPAKQFPKYGGLPLESFCATNACVHWVESGPHAPSLTDGNTDGTPDYVEEMAAAVEFAWTTEVTGFGFLTPTGDAGASNGGPDDRLDVYLAEIEDTFGPAYVPLELSDTVYMVVDDSYSLSLLPAGTGSEFIADVIAHELFHVIQNEYDFLDDKWLIEGSAAWIEDEVYDDLDYFDIRLDGRFGLSAFMNPEVPIDAGALGFEYGAGLFWRFLGELYGPSLGVPDRTMIRRILEFSDDEGPNSLEAVEAAVEERGHDFGSVFALFTVANFLPEAFYEEGSRYLQLVGRPPIFGKATITKRSPKVVTRDPFKIDHLSANYLQIKPGTGVSPSAKVKVKVDAPPANSNPAATLLLLRRDGDFQIVEVQLDASGDGTRKVSFGKGVISSVIIVLTNGSTRFDCFRQTVFSCQGESRDDRRPFKINATLVQ